MKKSKIIIPALGMLVLSTAASVTGTVAWFTTVQTANATLTSFAIRKVGGDLGLVIKTAADNTNHGANNETYNYGLGTMLSGESIVLEGTNPALCDASYDHVTQKKIYKANSNASAFSTLAGEANWAVSGHDQTLDEDMITYYAVEWTLQFTYTFGGDTGNVNLYFDLSQAVLTGTQVKAGVGANASKYTYKGFRVAFINGNTRTVVWAGGLTSDDLTAADPKFQGGTAPANATTYSNVNSDSAAGTLITGAGATRVLDPVAEDTSGSATRADFIGVFTPAAPTLSIKCIAWYEGNDPTVVNGARMDSTTATMAFYTRPAAA